MAEESLGAVECTCKECGEPLTADNRPTKQLLCRPCRLVWVRNYFRMRRHGTTADPTFCCKRCGKQLSYVPKKGRQKQYCDGCDRVYIQQPKYSKTCPYCSKQFMALHERNKFCSKACQYASFVAPGNVAGTRSARNCDECGKSYIPRPGKQQRTGEKQSRFCSRACTKTGLARTRKPARAKPPPLAVVECTICERQFQQRTRNNKYCSRECRNTLQRSKYDKKKCIETTCRECNKRFIPETAARTTFCSDECSTRSARRMRKHRTRARYYGVAYEMVHVESIFIRDNWRCQMCGRRTPAKLRGTFKDNAPELDHRIPMAIGGGHTYENVQCACRRCNIAKGGKRTAGQMPLFMHGL